MRRSGGKPRVLVLDDDPSFRGLLCTVLANLEIDIMEAPKRSNAMGLVNEHGVDFVIVDGLLPDGDGQRFLEDLKARGGDGPPTPGIFVSAFRRDAESQRKLTTDLGVRAVLMKPVAPEAILRLVIEALDLEVPPALLASLPAVPQSPEDSDATPSFPSLPAISGALASSRPGSRPAATPGAPSIVLTSASSSSSPSAAPASGGASSTAPRMPAVSAPSSAPRPPNAPTSGAPTSGAPQPLPSASPAAPLAASALEAPANAAPAEVSNVATTSDESDDALTATMPAFVSPEVAKAAAASARARMTSPTKAPAPRPSSAPPAPGPSVASSSAMATSERVRPSAPPPSARFEAPRVRTIQRPKETPVLVPEVDSAVASLEARLRAAQEAYKADLAADLARLQHSVERLRVGPADADAIEAILGEAHRIRGTSGTFGWLELGAALEQLETTLALFRDLPDLPGAWARVDAALEGTLRTARAGGASPSAPPRSRRAPIVLVVDDDEHFLETLGGWAARMGVQVNAATTAAKALAAASAEPPTAALVSFRLGRQEGPALAKSLRGIAGLETLPIGILSTADTLEARSEALHAGASVFLAKPLPPEAFVTGLERLLVSRGTSTRRALLVSDSAERAILVESAIAGAGIDAATVNAPPLVWSALRTYDPDLLLLDAVHDGGVSALDLCRMLRSDPRRHDLPIFVLTDGSPEARTDAHEAGADDVFGAPLDPGDLRARAGVRIERMRALKVSGERDPLTGLLSRGTFAARFSELLSAARRQKQSVTLCVLDIDGLRSINERFGQAIGDHVVMAVGRLLRQRFRAEDLRGRWGGDEFVLAFTGQRASIMRDVVGRVQRELAETDFYDGAGEPFRCSMAAGLATIPEDGESITDAFRHADRRLEEGRARG